MAASWKWLRCSISLLCRAFSFFPEGSGANDHTPVGFFKTGANLQS